MEKLTAVILAAGEGKRMKSALPKVLHSVCGYTLLEHVLNAVGNVCEDSIVVIGHGADRVRKVLNGSARFVHQEQQFGTGHAVMQAMPVVPRDGAVFILCGDTPLLSSEVLQNLLDIHRKNNAAATVLTAIVPDATGYGRIIRTADGSVCKIVEEKDASQKERLTQEINTGTYIFSAEALHEVLQQLSNANEQGEYYLTDCIELLVNKGLSVTSYCIDDHRLALGVNDRTQLAEAEQLMRWRINAALMAGGVTIIDPSTTYVDAGISVGADTVLLPGTLLRGRTTIGERCFIGPHSEITDTMIGSDVTVRHSVVTGSVLEDQVVVGPFAHLRPETRLRQGVKVGDFVEIKKSDIGNGSKIPHLAYIGDAMVGCKVNLGAGTIIVNYDGRKKHVTQIDDHTFVGCNSNLVAPLHIGKGAFVAAGSTITRDIPAGALSLGRAKQVNKENMAKRFLDEVENSET